MTEVVDPIDTGAEVRDVPSTADNWGCLYLSFIDDPHFVYHRTLKPEGVVHSLIYLGIWIRLGYTSQQVKSFIILISLLLLSPVRLTVIHGASLVQQTEGEALLRAFTLRPKRVKVILPQVSVFPRGEISASLMATRNWHLNKMQKHVDNGGGGV